MSATVCVAANTLLCTGASGHLWVYLNWALGLRALGCRVIWLEGVPPGTQAEAARSCVKQLKERLQRYGLAEQVGLFFWDGQRLAPELAELCLGLEEALEADLLLNVALWVAEIRSRLKRLSPGASAVLWFRLGQ